MHINVSHILTGDIGSNTGFKITGETIVLPDVKLTEPIEGEIRLTRMDFGLASSGQASTSLELECHRCLSTFSYSVKLNLTAEFSTHPQPEQWPIDNSQTIDLGPLMHQELVLATPIKQLCRPDCLGLCLFCAQRQETLHQHPEAEIRRLPRIVKSK